MAPVDVTIEICGLSGDGTIAAGGILNQAMSRSHYSVLAFDTYPAEIRGFGRCVTRSRFGDAGHSALTDSTQVLLSLDDGQSISRIPFLGREAVVLYDSNPPVAVGPDQAIVGHLQPTTKHYGAPFRDLALKATGSARGRNISALGSLAGLFGLDEEPFRQVITAKFEGKGVQVVEANLNSFAAGLAYVREHFGQELPPPIPRVRASSGPRRVLMSGNAAIADGALAAGVKNYFGYPITPATPIMEILAGELPSRGGRVVQMEDEISSIAAVLGSFHAGVRAMTATSGPGFALMTELIVHGVASETPAVIVNAQRGGPSTGLPTKTEQSDLHAAVFGGPGDSARIVIAPSNVTECYLFTAKSFFLAERYQTPVIVLTDFHLDNRVENVTPPQASPQELADGTIYPVAEDKEAYRRYRLTPSGISPRSLPGMEGLLYNATGLEHTEEGKPDFSSQVHQEQSAKRHRKLQKALEDLWPPEVHGDLGPLELGVLAWGSTFGAVQEAMETARKQGRRVGAMKVASLYPFHQEEISRFMARCSEILICELNYEGQLANLIAHLHAKPVHRYNRVTGQPMPPMEIFSAMNAVLKGEAA